MPPWWTPDRARAAWWAPWCSPRACRSGKARAASMARWFSGGPVGAIPGAGRSVRCSCGAACVPCQTSSVRCITCACYDAPMPAKNPRLTITLSPSLHAMLRRLSELTGSSQSSLIGELLEGSVPVLGRTCVVLEAARDAKDAMRGRLAEDIGAAQAKIEQQLGLALGDFDKLTGSLLADVEEVKRRATRKTPAARAVARGAGSAAGAATAPDSPPARAKKARPGVGLTPLSNRGVRNDPEQTKKSTMTRG